MWSSACSTAWRPSRAVKRATTQPPQPGAGQAAAESACALDDGDEALEVVAGAVVQVAAGGVGEVHQTAEGVDAGDGGGALGLEVVHALRLGVHVQRSIVEMQGRRRRQHLMAERQTEGGQ